MVVPWELEATGAVVYAVPEGRLNAVLVKSFRVMQWLTAGVPGIVSARRCTNEEEALRCLMAARVKFIPVRTYAAGCDEEEFDVVVGRLKALIEERRVSALPVQQDQLVPATDVSCLPVTPARVTSASATASPPRVMFHTAKAKYPNTCMFISRRAS